MMVYKRPRVQPTYEAAETARPKAPVAANVVNEIMLLVQKLAIFAKATEKRS